MAGKIIEGKSPKEASGLIGKPMSANYHKYGSTYHLIYSISDKEVFNFCGQDLSMPDGTPL
jgi:hypothetical protein